MLVDVKFFSHPIGEIIAKLNKNPEGVKRITKGVYEIGHFSLEHMISSIDTYPDLGDFNCYGVCDNYEQIIDQCPELQNKNRNFVVSITPIKKENQSPEGGWRWHKWGPYIGVQESQCEYLYDEPNIEMVYCYRIIEV